MQASEWAAFLNKMPPPPDNFYVVGSMVVPNPGIRGVLAAPADGHAENGMLRLELYLVQEPGFWPQVLTTLSVRYDRVVLPDAPAITAVEVFGNGEKVAFIDDVQIVV